MLVADERHARGKIALRALVQFPGEAASCANSWQDGLDSISCKWWRERKAAGHFGEKPIGRVVMLENTQLNYERAPLQRTKRQGGRLLPLNLEINSAIARQDLQYPNADTCDRDRLDGIIAPRWKQRDTDGFL